MDQYIDINTVSPDIRDEILRMNIDKYHQWKQSISPSIGEIVDLYRNDNKLTQHDKLLDLIITNDTRNLQFKYNTSQYFIETTPYDIGFEDPFVSDLIIRTDGDVNPIRDKNSDEIPEYGESLISYNKNDRDKQLLNNEIKFNITTSVDSSIGNEAQIIGDGSDYASFAEKVRKPESLTSYSQEFISNNRKTSSKYSGEIKDDSYLLTDGDNQFQTSTKYNEIYNYKEYISDILGMGSNINASNIINGIITGSNVGINIGGSEWDGDIGKKNVLDNIFDGTLVGDIIGLTGSITGLDSKDTPIGEFGDKALGIIQANSAIASAQRKAGNIVIR